MGIYDTDLKVFQECLKKLPKNWDGKDCILELKSADYQWRQMEWWAFYFEYKARQALQNRIQIPGDRFGNVTFDLKGTINWDLKASAIKTHNHVIILNDKEAMDLSVQREGFHGEIIALCDVEYNDQDRSFQKWHTELKGGKSRYELEREKRTAVSRYRKKRATLEEILFVILKPQDLENLNIMQQGRNSDGSPRKVKYMLNLEELDDLEFYKLTL
jgi:hypothetical protein